LGFFEASSVSEEQMKIPMGFANSLKFCARFGFLKAHALRHLQHEIFREIQQDAFAETLVIRPEIAEVSSSTNDDSGFGCQALHDGLVVTAQGALIENLAASLRQHCFFPYLPYY
jgi:hypothetical protein